jgi:hypothetical protein
LTPSERKLWRGLTTPIKIQAYLDTIPYTGEERYRCPLTFLRDGTGHCFDGALFAAAALRALGYPPLWVDLIPGDDDDHILAVFQRNRCWGAVAKSNFSGLRYREPVYRSLRELAMSYFEDYYSLTRKRTLRGYTRPLDLATFDHLNWMTSDDGLDDIGVALGEITSYKLLTPAQVRALNPLDERSFNAGAYGADLEESYMPKA